MRQLSKCPVNTRLSHLETVPRLGPWPQRPFPPLPSVPHKALIEYCPSDPLDLNQRVHNPHLELCYCAAQGVIFTQLFWTMLESLQMSDQIQEMHRQCRHQEHRVSTPVPFVCHPPETFTRSVVQRTPPSNMALAFDDLFGHW